MFLCQAVKYIKGNWRGFGLNKQYCIFDMDGTLVDSMGVWKNLGRTYLERLGVSPTQKQLDATGPMTMEESAAYFKQQFNLTLSTQQMIQHMNHYMETRYCTDIPLKKGALDYILRLKKQGVSLCVATATEEALAAACLERLGIMEQLDFLLSCETVGAGKTKPDIYYEAAKRLGASPCEIAVFEDAPYAIHTARKAGFYVVGVYEPVYAHHWSELQKLCHECITTFSSGID